MLGSFFLNIATTTGWTFFFLSLIELFNHVLLYLWKAFVFQTQFFLN